MGSTLEWTISTHSVEDLYLKAEDLRHSGHDLDLQR